MQQKKDNIIKSMVFFLMPIILLLALYVQMHGDYSPGGGFQAGAIAASMLVVYSMIAGTRIPILYVRIVAIIGIVIYAGAGCIAMIMGGDFLDYSVLLSDPVSGEGLGVMLVEAGVGFTVFASMLLIYNSFSSK